MTKHTIKVTLDHIDMALNYVDVTEGFPELEAVSAALIDSLREEGIESVIVTPGGVFEAIPNAHALLDFGNDGKCVTRLPHEVDDFLREFKINPNKVKPFEFTLFSTDNR